jgi:hypothetical protein
MKKIWIISVVIAAGLAHGALISDGFETYTAGNNIGGTGGWVDYQTSVDQGFTVAATNSTLSSGSQSMHLVDNDASALSDPRLQNVLAEDIVTTGVFTFDFMAVVNSNTPLVTVRSTSSITGPQAVALSISPNALGTGKCSYHDGTTWQSLSTALALGTWYQFEITADTATDTFDLAIYKSTGLYQSYSDLAFRTAVGSLRSIDFATNAGTGKTDSDFYVDSFDVNVVPEPVTLGLFASAGAVLLLLRRIRK